MIASLRGVLLSRGEDDVVVEVGGIGYRVLVAPTTAFGLGDVGDEVFVWVHHHVREDAQVLYGFPSEPARRCFTGLLGAHGVGPSLALAILSVHGPDALARVLLDDDIDALCLVPGVGKKTAARLLVELKGRLDIPIDLGPSRPVGAGRSPERLNARADVRDALAELGYSAEEIRQVLSDLPDEDDSAVLLRQALSRLAVFG